MGTQKRYVATITVYVYAEDDKSALEASKTICDKINHNDEVPDATVDALHKRKDGQLGSDEIDIEKLEEKMVPCGIGSFFGM